MKRGNFKYKDSAVSLDIFNQHSDLMLQSKKKIYLKIGHLLLEKQVGLEEQAVFQENGRINEFCSSSP